MNNHITLPHNHGEDSQKIVDKLPSDEVFSKSANMFSLVSDGNRLKIFWLLTYCEECVINIAAAVEMSSPAVSHHLRMLKASGYIVSRKDGKEVYYRAADNEDSRTMQRVVKELIKCEIKF